MLRIKAEAVGSLLVLINILNFYPSKHLFPQRYTFNLPSISLFKIYQYRLNLSMAKLSTLKTLYLLYFTY